MGLESTFNFIGDLEPTNPATGDDLQEGDNHIRGIKSAIQGSFTSLGSTAVTTTAAELNVLDGITKTTAELNASSSFDGSATTTASGASVTIGGIPSYAKQVRIVGSALACSGSGITLELLLGDSGGMETSGYSYTIAQNTSIPSTAIFSATSASEWVVGNFAAGSVLEISIDITLEDASTNRWVMSSTMGDHTAATKIFRSGVGAKSLTAALTQLRIECSGVATFTAGNFKVYWAG